MTERLFWGAMEMRRLPGAERSSSQVKPPGEEALRGIVGRFEETEAQIRRLLGAAIDGDRESLLAEALEAISSLRDERFEDAVFEAYDTAYEDAADEIEAQSRDGLAPDSLAESLHKKLTAATEEAEKRSEKAFPEVTEDNLESISHEAVTAMVDEEERNWTLGAYAAMAALTLGRRATSRGIKAASAGGELRISVDPNSCPICLPFEGETYPANSAPEPPFHERCGHMLEPVA